MVEVLSFLLLGLRWVHFLGGVAWIGTIFYLGMVQLPSMRRGNNGSVSTEYVSKLNLVLVITSMSSIIAGVSMALFSSRLNAEVFLSSYWGVSILAGGLFALAALVTTFAGVLPSLEKLSSKAVDSDERAAVLGKTQKLLNITIILGVLVLLMMASAVSPL